MLQLLQLLLQLLRQPADQIRHTASPATEQMRRQVVDQALQVVSARVRSKLTVPELAAAVNVSSSQLTRLFHTYLGVSPAKHITRTRLEEAKSLLTGGELSVGEVADLLGYTSIQHFSRQFREWVGCTPTAYAHKNG